MNRTAQPPSGTGSARSCPRLALQTPTIPLTSRGMHRPRHRPRSSARLSFSLLSVLLALLMVAALPALAQADSSGIQYETEHYEAGVKPKPKHSNPGGEKEAEAEASQQPKGQKSGSQPPNQKSGEGEEEKSGAVPAGNGGNNNGGGGRNASPGGGNAGAETGLGNEKPVATTQGEQASNSSGGSSPLVPILIAVAVLAAISIGAVLYRQRRQGGSSGSPVSPKAG